MARFGRKRNTTRRGGGFGGRRDPSSRLLGQFTGQKSSNSRRLRLEPLETRLLLDAVPLYSAAFATEAVDWTLRIEDVAGVETLKLVDTQLGQMLASQALDDISEVVHIVGSNFGDVLRLDIGTGSISSLLPAGISFDAGGGADRLRGPSANTNWNVTGSNAGNVGGSGVLDFSNVENLVGQAENEDQFTFHVGGSLTGLVDGGAAGWDTLVLEGGVYQTVEFTATGPDSGTVALDDNLISYAGMEPISAHVTGTNDLIFNATAGNDNFTLKNGSAGNLQIVDNANTFEDGEFTIPTNSLTINGLGGDDTITIETTTLPSNVALTINGDDGADSVTMDGNLSLQGGDLTVNAETITVNADKTVSNTSGGNVTLTAVAENDFVGSSSPASIDISAQILVNGIMRVDGSLTLDATVNNTVDLDASGISLAIESQSSAVAQIGSTAIVVAGTLTVSAVTNTDFAIDITNATSGASGIGADVVDAPRRTATLLSTSGPAKFYLWDATSVDTSAATYVVTHGWNSELDSDWHDLLNALRAVDADANILFTDWSEQAKNLNYPEAADDTYGIGGLLASLLETSGINPSTTTLIGHGLGGQVSGIAADRYEASTGNSIARVIALDPAGPFFEGTLGFPAKTNDKRLDATDADRVVALHTTSTLGYDGRLADLDLYVNPGELNQPGTSNFIGSHSYATTLLTELLQGKTFSQAPGLVGTDLEYADLLNTTLTGMQDVETYDTPIKITTIAGIEGGRALS